MIHFLLRSSAFLLVVALGGCSSPVPPYMKVYGPIDPAIPPLLYVTTTAQRETVLAALKLAGFSIASDLREAPLTLSVRLERTRATRECGSVRNVVYKLQHAGALIAHIRGRGWTGSCTPNILLDMSAELACLFDRGV